MDITIEHADALAIVKQGREVKYKVLLGKTFVPVTETSIQEKRVFVENIKNRAKKNTNHKFIVGKDSVQLGEGQSSSRVSVPIACTCMDWIWRGYACTEDYALQLKTCNHGCKHMIATKQKLENSFIEK